MSAAASCSDQAPAAWHARADNERVRVCVSLPFARQLLTGTTDYFGGAEVRGATFVFGLARDPTFDIHVVVRGAGWEPLMRSDGITVHCRPEVPFYEGHHDDAVRSVWGVIDADVYVAFGANEATAELARFCKAHGSAFVLFVASDCAFDALVYEGSLQADAYGVPGHYAWYALHNAHAVAVQTERQQLLFRELEGREATLIRNPALSTVREPARLAPQYGGRMLWVGRVDPNKRHDEALMLARALPHRPMIMVCNNLPALGETARDDLQRALPNLMLADQVALPDMDALFRFSDVVVNTSVVEGFPNTFLQAGMFGIPIVSMAVDPDRMLSRHGCGRVADGTRDGLARAVEGLLTSPTEYASAAAASARWIRERHDTGERVAELAAVIHHAAISRTRRELHRVR